MIVAFCGPDGSGKTTHARLIYHTLCSKHVRVRYARLRSHHMIMYMVIKFLQLCGVLPRTSSPMELDFSIRHKFSKARSLLALLELVSAISWIILNIKLPKALGYSIVAERYIPDFLVSLRILTPNHKMKITRLANSLMKRLCRNAIIIFLYSEPPILVERKRDEKITKYYAEYLLKIYREVLSELKVISIDTSHVNVWKIHQALRNVVLKTIT
mgnify:CR=1 FL=1